MSETKHIDAEAFKRRILSYGIVHEGDRIPIPFYKHYFAKAYVAMLRWVCEEVDDTPAADIPQWIPVTERLPKHEKTRYWICTDTGYQCECRWTDNRFGIGNLSGEWGWSIFDTPQYSKVIAWMELPEPYKGGEEE